VELGSQDYTVNAYLNKAAATAIVIYQRPGSNALTTAAAVREQLAAAALTRTAGAPSLQFLATDGPERFARVGSRFLGRTIEAQQIELIDL